MKSPKKLKHTQIVIAKSTKKSTSLTPLVNPTEDDITLTLVTLSLVAIDIVALIMIV
jgi:hypothetical protein